MRNRPAARKSFGRRLLRWIAIAASAWVALTAVPVLLLRWVDPVTSSFMLRARYGAWAADDAAYRTRYEWVDYEAISPHAAIAVIAAEDQLFPVHRGFDLKSIREAAERNGKLAANGKAIDKGKNQRIRGASTITQQVAKNLFLSGDRSYLRKGVEAWFTVLIELTWPKQRILEVYLNVAEMGRGIYGVEAAARKFFRKPAKQLTRSEAATLAAVLPSPTRMRADKPSRYVATRRDWILGQMRSLGGKQYLAQLESRS
jgi:monofunctional biosynthetic peptidoglycan transglycosylase